MLSIQVMSIQINISWQKKDRSIEKLNRIIHANNIEKKLEEMKYKNLEHMRHI